MKKLLANNPLANLTQQFTQQLKTDAPAQPPPQQPPGDKQYLRLPLDSARKLRWYDKADLQALNKAHFREKRELLDTVAALKKVLLRNGLEESKLDVEVQAHLRVAAEVEEAHEGVASVLLASLEQQMAELRFECQQLKASAQMRPRTSQSQATSVAQSVSGVASDGAPAAAAQQQQPLEPLRLQYLDLALLDSPQQAAISKMPGQRLCRRVMELEAQNEQLAAQLEQLRAARRPAEQQAEAGGAPATSGSGASGASAAGLRQLQDMAAEAMEQAREEARRASRAEARSSRLEQELRDLQTQHRALTKEAASMKQELVEMREEMMTAAAAVVAAESAAARAGQARLQADCSAELAAAQAQAAELMAQLAAAKALAAQLEAEVQASHLREAAATSALRDAEALSRHNDELLSSNLALGQRLSEAKAGLAHVDHLRKVCGELEAAKARLEGEVMSLAQLSTSADARLMDLQQRLAAAEEGQRSAEQRAKAAEAGVSSEVDRRLGAVLASRALWPEQLREEFGGLEARCAGLKAQLDAAQGRLAAEQAMLREAEGQLRDKEEQLQRSSGEAATTISALQSELDHVRGELQELHGRAAITRAELEAAKEALSSTPQPQQPAQAQPGRAGPGPGGGGGGGPAGGQAAAGAGANGLGGSHSASTGSLGTVPAIVTPKWQVQNRIGSGALYNMDGSSSGGTGGSSAPANHHAAAAGSVNSVDLAYLKNVLLKFMDAHLCGRAAERDVLLPAVATLLQASHEEYVALTKVCKATAPPSRQVLSVLGLKL